MLALVRGPPTSRRWSRTFSRTPGGTRLAPRRGWPHGPTAQRPVLSTAKRYELMAELRSARAARGKDLAPFQTLTSREQAVLAGLAQGRRAEIIAAAAFLSEATVRSQIRSVLAKLGVNSQLEAVALAWTVGWFSTPAQTSTPSTIHLL